MRTPATGCHDADAQRVRFPLANPNDRALRDGYSATECLGDNRPDSGADGGIVAGRGLSPRDRGWRKQPGPAGCGPDRSPARIRSARV
jgi:hypothetical protein